MPNKANVILVVDDDDAARYAKSNMLKRAGFTVEQAGSGAETFAAIKQKRANLILLDIQLPDMNGLEICEAIRADPDCCAIPILQTSATFTDAADAAAGLNRGADAYLAEPLKEDVLVATINALLRAKRAEDELRSQREKFEVTLASIGDGVIATDKVGKIVFMNPVAETLSGWTCAEAIHHTISEVLNLVDEKTRESVVPPLGLFLDRPDAAHLTSPMVLISKNGVEWPLEGNVAPIRNGADSVSGKVIVFREITERKRAEKHSFELLASEQKARQEAEKANKAKDEFLAIVSHELRTPLTSLMGWSRLLKNGKLTREQSVHAIEALERGINSQKQIIEDLLDVSRIVAGKLHLERKIVPLDVVILHAIDAIKPAAANKGVELRVEAEPVELFADENRIQQVLWNLLNNAIKFTLLGGHVKLVAKKVNSNCVITVTDTGRGIEPAFLPYLFDRFTQFDSSASRDTGGLGLGLAISRSLIEKHGGEITASSEGLGKGSTFTVKLPAYLAIHSNSEAQEKPLETQQTIRLDDTHILLIEDQLDTQELISLIVRTAGATITAVNSTDSALSAYLAKRPSILICDVGLPGEDGYTFMRRFRIFEKSLGWSVPTLALTAHAREDDRWNALKAGYQAHLGKPFDTNTLLQVISNLIGHSRKE